MSAGVDTSRPAGWTPRRRLVAGICLVALHMAAIVALVAAAILAR